MDNDLKDSIKKIEEVKKRQEKIEKLIILLAGIFALLIFAIVGINIYYSGKEQVSEPKVVIEDEKATATYTAQPQPAQEPVKAVNTVLENKQELQKEEKQKSVKKEQPQNKAEKPKEKVESSKKQEKTKTTQTKVAKTEFKHEKPKVKVASTAPSNTPEKTQPQKSYTKSYIYTIQVGAFSSEEKAEKFLKSLGHRGFIVKSKGIYRVFVGRFDSYKDAVSYMKKHHLKGFVRKIKG